MVLLESLEVAASSPRSRLSREMEGDTVERTESLQSRAGELLVERPGPASVTTPLSASLASSLASSWAKLKHDTKVK